MIAFSTTIILSTLLGFTAPSNRVSTQTNQITAQTNPTGQPSSPAPSTRQTAEPNRNAANSPDSSFMMEAAQGGMSEVLLGQLAQQQAASDSVKQFGQRMVQDHSRANAQLMQLFQQKGITPPETIGAKYGAMQEQLERLSGSDFDREYIDRMIEDHTEDIASFQREVDNGRDPDVQAWATNTLPTLREHLQLARTIQQSLGSR